jgi:hypothetical protein
VKVEEKWTNNLVTKKLKEESDAYLSSRPRRRVPSKTRERSQTKKTTFPFWKDIQLWLPKNVCIWTS